MKGLSLSNLNLGKLRQRDWTIIIAVLTVIAGVLWYFYMFKPTLETIAGLNQEIVELNDEIEVGNRAKANIPQLQEQKRQAEADRDDFLRELPRESDVASLLDTLRLSASEAGIVLESINQGRSEGGAVQDVRALGFSLATVGKFGETMTFLDTLENLKRFTRVQQVDLSTNEDGIDNPELNASYDFTVYVYTGADVGAVQ